MFEIIKSGTNYDFLGKAPLWIRISVATFVAGVLVLLIKGPNLGLDFTGGHEMLVEFAKPVHADEVRAQIEKLKLGDASVQSYDVRGSERHYFLVRVQRTESLGKEELATLESGFKGHFGPYFKRMRYNPEAGDVVELDLTATASVAHVDTSTGALAGIIGKTNHDIRQVRNVGRADEPRFSVTLKGVDAAILKLLQDNLDPAAKMPKIEFVGPTVGKQLRNDGILAVGIAMLFIMLYVALRFDFFFSPGAVICLFHDAVITVALMSAIGEEFSMTTIAAMLTLVGYSINDTIIVFDRIRETMGKATGTALKDVVNRSTNETLSRTVLTSSTVLLACLCLMIFGHGTVLYQFGLIMFVGVIFGTYSSIYVASPIFIYLHERFAPPAVEPGPKKGKAPARATV